MSKPSSSQLIHSNSLRSQQALLRADTNQVKADQYLIMAEQHLIKTDLEKVYKDQQQIQKTQSFIKDTIIRNKGNQHNFDLELALIKADQELTRTLIQQITAGQEELETMLSNIKVAPSCPTPKPIIEKIEKETTIAPSCPVIQTTTPRQIQTENQEKTTVAPSDDHVPKKEISPAKTCINDRKEILIPSFNSEAFRVPCDDKTRGGNWLIILRRMDGSEKFNRPWNDYKFGFGSLHGEFFLGLDKIHAITNDKTHELLIVLEDFEGNEKYEKYESFAIANETELYRLNILGVSTGNAGDSLRYHKDMNFSTSDRDNDGSSTTNCAKEYSGAWWFNKCHTR